MSQTGCGHPTPFGDTLTPCGTYLGLGELVPILCPPCQTMRAFTSAGTWGPAERARQAHDVALGATCEGCRVSPATRTRPPFLCDACEAAYARDLEAGGDQGEPGSRCTPRCGYCGRCGGA